MVVKALERWSTPVSKTKAHRTGIFTSILAIFYTMRGILLVDRFVFSDAWTQSLLFKSKETLKLAEIQNLEASLQTNYSDFFFDHLQDEFVLKKKLHRLLVDRATGSSIFRLDLKIKRRSERSFRDAINDDGSSMPLEVENLLRKHILSMSSVQRCDWIGQVIIEGQNPHEMVKKLQEQQDTLISSNRCGLDVTGWSLDYAKFVGKVASKKKKPTHTMKSLLCAVAHEMPCRPSLTPDQTKNHLLIVDTATESISPCFLIQCIYSLPMIESKSSLQLKWAQRPFQYSSAINFEIADMVMDILSTLCDSRSCFADKIDSTRRILFDPTCGSGTFLALAMARGFFVEGCDISRNAAEGAIRNLEYLFDEDKVNHYATVETRDSCDPWRRKISSTQNITGDFSCVVANLPWGRNSILYIDENKRILRSVRSQIHIGTPCAFITRPSDAGENKSPLLLFESTGFDIVGQAFVPQRDFLLPTGKKKRKKPQSTNFYDEYSSSARKQNQCVVTIARAK